MRNKKRIENFDGLLKIVHWEFVEVNRRSLIETNLSKNVSMPENEAFETLSVSETFVTLV